MQSDTSTSGAAKPNAPYDFLISRSGADSEAALVVEEILRKAGFTAYIQEKDFGATAFPERMDEGLRAVEGGARIIGLLTADYLASPHCMVEAQHPLVGDPHNGQQRLILLRFDDCTPIGALTTVPYFDLLPLLDDDEAFERVVLGAVAPGRDAGLAHFAALHRRARRQILHAGIRPVPAFAGRAAELGAIDRALWSGNAVVVHGPSGAGKSSLARQSAWDNHERYVGVWWIDGTTRESIIADLVSLGARLIPGLDETPDRARAARLTLDTLVQAQGAKPWLLIYDEVGSPDALANLTPAADAHVLVTSPQTGWQGHGTAIPLDVFPRPLAMDYLLTQSRQRDAASAGRLADDLGCMPLALSLARATCRAAGLDFDAYRAALPGVVSRAPRDAGVTPAMFAAFDLALKRAAERCPSAEKLLGIAAFLAPGAIPLDIIAADVMSPRERTEAAAALSEVGLADVGPLDDGSMGFSVHLLVQAAMRERLGESREEVAALATRLVAEAFPHGEGANDPADVDSWPACMRLEAHAKSVLAFAPDRGASAKWTAVLCNHLALCLDAMGDHGDAEPLLRRALSVARAVHGEAGAEVASYAGDLASSLMTTGRMDEAEALFRSAIEINERSRGTSDPSVAELLSDLAGLLRQTDRREEAETLLRRALQIEEAAHGSGSAGAGIRVNDLAQLLKDTDRWAEAVTLLRRAFEIAEGQSGPDHPTTAARLAELAVLLSGRGSAAEAVPMLRRALAIDEANHGPDHPDVALALSHLAGALRSTGNLEEALPLARRALAIDEAFFDPEHPIIARRHQQIATLLAELGRPAEADAYIRHALLAAEKSLGADHPETQAYRASYEKIIASVEAMARADAAVEAGLAPVPPEWLARPDVPAPGRPGILGRLLKGKS